MKHCNKCDTTKPFSDFNTNKSKSDGYQTTCKACRKAYNQKHYQRNKETYKTRSLKWKRDNPARILAQRYFVSEEEISEVIRAFPACGICSSSEGLVIDHCHETGAIRGRLCGNCNKLLGFLGDNLSSVVRFTTAAIGYLENAAEEELKG